MVVCAADVASKPDEAREEERKRDPTQIGHRQHIAARIKKKATGHRHTNIGTHTHTSLGRQKSVTPLHSPNLGLHGFALAAAARGVPVIWRTTSVWARIKKKEIYI